MEEVPNQAGPQLTKRKTKLMEGDNLERMYSVLDDEFSEKITQDVLDKDSIKFMQTNSKTNENLARESLHIFQENEE